MRFRLGARAFALAASRAARSATSIAFSVAMSLGSESSALIANEKNTTPIACEPSSASRVTMPHSAGCLRSPRVLRHSPIDAFQQVAELRRGDRHHAVRRRRPDEASTLQPLREQAQTPAIVPQNLKSSPSYSPEGI